MTRRSRLSRFSSEKRQDDEVVLQITSMADIFTIILVFLLKNYSVSAETLSQSMALSLPEAVANDKVEEQQKIEISREGIYYNEGKVVDLNQFTAATGVVSQDGAIPALVSALRSETPHKKLLVFADAELPYQTLKAVMTSASLAGTSDFKLVVAAKESE